MFFKFVVAIILALVTLIAFRQFSERDRRARVRIKNKSRQQEKTRNLVWDEATQSYRAED